MKQQIIILYAAQYSMVDERTGQVNQGVTCNYYFNTNLSVEDNVNGSKGMRPAKGTLDFHLMGKILKAPALYDAEFTMSIGSDMKPVLKISDLEFITEVSILPVTPAGAKDADKGAEKKAG